MGKYPHLHSSTAELPHKITDTMLELLTLALFQLMTVASSPAPNANAVGGSSGWSDGNATSATRGGSSGWSDGNVTARGGSSGWSDGNVR